MINFIDLNLTRAELKQYFDNLGFQTTYRRSLNESNIIFSIRWDGE